MAEYQTLYRKWRPQTFDDVVGQEHITSILKYQVAERRINHAYLFCGSRGTGKTTCAKLLAKAVNCEHPQNGNPCGVCDACRGIASGQITDVIEMDAASNNGVDNIRDIRDDVIYAPTACKKRVFIIDEVHMLSTSAFNALLKTLEEPPEHIVFILATTEMNKIPATILSRCQRYDFHRIETATIAARLRKIADAEQIAIGEDALFLIGKTANGGMRDAIGMLELCAGNGSGKPLDAETVAALIGVSPYELNADIVRAIRDRQYDRLFGIVDRLYKDARDIGVFWQSLTGFYRDMLVAKTVHNASAILDLPKKQAELPITLAHDFSMETLLYHTGILDRVYGILAKNTVPARLTVEMALVRMCDSRLETTNEALNARIAALEDRIALGVIVPPESHTETLQNEPEISTDSAACLPVTEKESVSVPKQPPVNTSPAASSKKVLRAFRGWAEVVKRMESVDAGLNAFLRTYKAYTCEQDGRFYLQAPDAFSVNLIKKTEYLEKLRDAVNLVSAETDSAGAKKYTVGDLIIETLTAAKQNGYETIDEIIETAGDTAALF